MFIKGISYKGKKQERKKCYISIVSDYKSIKVSINRIISFKVKILLFLVVKMLYKRKIENIQNK